MKKLFYKITLYLSHKLGLWFLRTLSWFIATGYYFLFPLRVKESVKFYRALFPERGFATLCTVPGSSIITLPMSISTVLFHWAKKISNLSVKAGNIWTRRCRKNRRDLVMSHIGNWELAAQTLNQKGLPIMLYLGAKHKEQIEHIQKETMAQKRHKNHGDVRR